ncbi:MAG: hypothetical protein E7524_05655 [Ruminococcaceae bacterium]|nr:hypothetical protein [Oscillospiraceae bacterium]
MTKFEQALETCEKILTGIELGTLTTSSMLMMCLRVARLTNDTDAIEWLEYENSGYPQDEDGYILSRAWKIGWKHGRGYFNKEKEKLIFTDLSSELEGRILSKRGALNNYSTSGASVSGEYAYVAMGNLTRTVSDATNSLLRNIAKDEKNLALLKAQYYDYASKKHIELSFSSTTADVFSVYREKVDSYFSKLPSDIISKLRAIDDKINSNNPELYSQALTTCRRLFGDVADELFKINFPNYTEKMYETKSGKEIDVSGEHYKNKLSAVIEKLQDKSANKCLIGSNILYLIDRMDTLNDLQCKGVHNEISKEDAMQCIIHTYICLGDILSLQYPN